MTSVEDAKCVGCPSVSKTVENVDWVKTSILKTRIVTTCKVANMLRIVLGSLLSILKDQNQCWITAKLMPHMLSEEQNCHVPRPSTEAWLSLHPFYSWNLAPSDLKFHHSGQSRWFRKNNQLDVSISKIYFCHKTLHVSGIFCAHHQGLSTVHMAIGTLHAGYVTAC